MMCMRRLSLSLTTMMLFIGGSLGCSFDFKRELELEPGDVAGRALRGSEGPAPYARVHVSGTGREHRTRSDGSFLVRGLVPGGFVLEITDDKDGDGWPERATRRTFTLTRAKHAAGLFGESEARATWVSLGEVPLEGIVEAEGRVLRADGTPAVGARVYALRDVELPASDDGRGALHIELPADAEIATDIDGRFRFPALPAGRLSFVAFAADEGPVLSSQPLTRSASPGVKLRDLELELEAGPSERRVLVDVVPVPAEDELVRVHVVPPGEAAPIAQGSFALGEPGVRRGARTLELDVPLGVWDLWVETNEGRFGVLRRQIASMPGGDALRWGLLLLDSDDPCAGTAADGTAIRDCDHDGLQGLPPLDDLDDPRVEIWRECAPQCAGAFGEDALGASCRVGGEVFDCDDDGDGQADVTEAISCYGLGRGADPDGDGLCGAADPYPQCRENDPEHPSCRAGGSFTEFPPPIRPEFDDGDVDAGPLPDGGDEDAGDGGDDGGFLDGGSDAGDGGSEAPPPPMADIWGGLRVEGATTFGEGTAVLIGSWGPLDIGGGCVLGAEDSGMLVLVDELGQCVWHVSLGPSVPGQDAGMLNNVSLQDLVVLESGELLVVGRYEGAVRISDRTSERHLTENDMGDLLLFTVDEGGGVTDHKEGGFTNGQGSYVTFDINDATALPTGGVLLIGGSESQLHVEIDDEPHVITRGTYAAESVLVLAFNDQLEPVWYHGSSTPLQGDMAGRAATVVGEGGDEHVIVLVAYTGPAHIDGVGDVGSDSPGGMLLAFPLGPEAPGELAWHRRIDGWLLSTGFLAPDRAGGFILGGTARDPFVLYGGSGGASPVTTSPNSFFLARYDGTGTLLEHHEAVSAADDESGIDLRTMVALPGGDLLIGGHFSSDFRLGDLEVRNDDGDANVFVARLDLSAGLDVVFFQRSYGHGVWLFDLAPLPDESTLVIGEGSGSFFLGGLRLDFSSGDGGAFIWRILPDGTSAEELLLEVGARCDVSGACESRLCGIPPWRTSDMGLCVSRCDVNEASSCSGDSSCHPVEPGGTDGVCVPEGACFANDQCESGVCNPFELRCEPGCETVDDCASGEACHAHLGVCVQDCFEGEVCGEGEVCTPSAQGYFCDSHCETGGQCFGQCGADGLCSVGGVDDERIVLDDTWLWDPTTLTFSHHAGTSSATPGPRRGHAMGGSGQGVVLIGGFDAEGNAESWEKPLVFQGGDWVAGGSSSEGTGYGWAGAGGASTGSTFIAYGVRAGTGAGVTLTLDCCGGELSAMDAFVEPEREGAAMAHDGLGRVWLFGGRGPSSLLNDLWVLDTQMPEPEWVQVHVTGGPSPRVDHALSFAGTPGELLLTGGRGADGGLLSDTWRLRYNETSGSATWVLVSDARLGHRAGHGMAWDGIRVVLYGGAASLARPRTRDVFIFDETSQRWIEPRLGGVPPPARTGVRMAFDGTQIVLHGGERGSNPVEGHDDVFEATVADGEITWARRAPVAPGVTDAAVASAPDGSALWVFGGRDRYGALTDQLVVYRSDGNDTVYSGVGPSAREGAGMAFHPSGELFLFGGRDASGFRADLWRWDDLLGGFELLRSDDLSGVSPRAFFAMAPSALDGEILLFSGLGDNGPLDDDLWLLTSDGDFTPLYPSTELPWRVQAAVASTPEGVFLFGGFGRDQNGNTGALRELWLWEGEEQGWRFVENLWPARVAPTLSYDPGSSPTLWIFGGMDNFGALSFPTVYDASEGQSWPYETGDSPGYRGRHAAGFVGDKLLIIGGSDERFDPTTILGSN